MSVNLSETQGDAEKSMVESATRRVYRYLDDALGSIGGIEVAAGLCGIDRGDLRRSLDRNGRRVAIEHALAIGARLRNFNAGLATKIASSLVEPMGLCVFPKVTLTAEERADRLERALRGLGVIGEQLITAALESR